MNVKKIYKFISKALSIALVILLVGGSAMRYPIVAQEETPPADPTPTTTTIDDSATTDTTVSTDANTGDNTVGATPTDTPTPTPTLDVQNTPTDTPTPTPDPSLTPAGTEDPVDPAANGSATIDTNADVTDTSTSTANTGENSVTTTGNSDPSPSSNTSDPASTAEATPTPEVSIMTGTAVAITSVDNSVNTTSVNSNIIVQTINIYIDQNAALDLSDPAAFITNTIKDHPTDPTINLHITSVTNQATVVNTVDSLANTGNNTATAGGAAMINTGDAYSIVSVLNRVNFVAIDSIVHVVTINIFGTLNGDIILPVPMQTSSASDPCPQCSGNTTVTNTATVHNTVMSGANSGNNNVTASISGSIQTGDATSEVSIDNLVNTVLIGDNVFSLYITPVGSWDGSFVGYQSVDPNSLNSMVITGADGQTLSCSATNLTSTNTATVTNVINSTANTGGNTIQAGSGTITTGNAVSNVSLINLVNTVLYHTTAFFGFINIFGAWHGNVGDQASLAKANAAPIAEVAQSSSETSGSGSGVQDSGGLLTVTNSNNVGGYVNPGDTVTFFIAIHNPGTGMVYGTSLTLHLFSNGEDVGGVTIPIGDIKIGGTARVTTGLQLTKDAPGGTYSAHAIATGTVGPDNNTISAEGDSTFAVAGSVLGSSSDTGPGAMTVSGVVPPTVQVMGATTRATDNANILLALLVLLLLVPQYIFYRATRNRRLLSFVFTNNINWQARLRAVQTFLL